jgi:hypothetical protein
MENLQDFLNVIDFIGDEMTDEQAERLMGEARRKLSIADIERLSNTLMSPAMCLEISIYEAEMGGFGRY